MPDKIDVSSFGYVKPSPHAPKDANQLAHFIVAQTAGMSPELLEGKHLAAVALGKLGAEKGGRARAKALTPEQRSKIARKAAKARWKKERK